MSYKHVSMRLAEKKEEDDDDGDMGFCLFDGGESPARWAINKPFSSMLLPKMALPGRLANIEKKADSVRGSGKVHGSLSGSSSIHADKSEERLSKQRSITAGVRHTVMQELQSLSLRRDSREKSKEPSSRSSKSLSKPMVNETTSPSLDPFDFEDPIGQGMLFSLLS